MKTIDGILSKLKRFAPPPVAAGSRFGPNPPCVPFCCDPTHLGAVVYTQEPGRDLRSGPSQSAIR